MFGHPAFRKLIALKIRGAVRGQFRKLKRPSSWIFMLLGACLLLFWFVSVFFAGMSQRSSSERDPELMFVGAQLLMALLCLMTVISAFSHRGLYLPREEIELAFSAPVSRGDLVRYRLLINLLRALLTGVVFGVLSALRMPHAGFGFAGAMLAISTVAVLGQATAILMGGAENRLGRLAQRWPLRRVSVVLVIVLVAAVAFLMAGGDSGSFESWRANLGSLRGDDSEALLRSLPESGEPSIAARISGHPLLHALLLPFTPWARAITATEASTFWPWFGVCAFLWLIAYEVTARLPVDFRELSLATSADVAKRLNRVRKGWVGVNSTTATKASLSWKVPWWFGRGSFGAVAWLKLGQIVRKARGTLFVSVLIVLMVSMVFGALFDEPSFEHALAGAALLATIGTIYLCMGLRFDFRADLDQMGTVRTWPLAPWRVFLATILPEVTLVSMLLWVAILARAALTDGLIPELACVLILQPLVTLTWVAIDNTVFLFSPVRYSPGQEGALQNMGRAVYLLMLRALVFSVVLLCAAVPIALTQWIAVDRLGWSARSMIWIASSIGALVLLAVDVALIAAGGWMLKRFDVARDRG